MLHKFSPGFLTLIYLCVAVSGFFGSAAAQPVVSRRTPVVEVVERVGPAIVNISTERVMETQSSPMFDEFFQEFFGKYSHPQIQKASSLGSGVLVDSKGFIVTNDHVIRRASKITITLSDKRSFEAELLASDSKHDLALLKIESPLPLPSITWGSSSDILIGETVIALGNPFGLQNSVTTGVVSATNRSLSLDGQLLFDDFIQTDAAINPGNSGGVLLNILGQLIGINTAMAAQGQGLGFAIPVNRVRQKLGDLLDYRKIKKFYLGLELEQIETGQGDWMVRIAQIIAGSPAAKSGLKKGELVVAADDTPIKCLFDLNKILYFKQAGDKVSLRLVQGGQGRTVLLPIAILAAAAPKSMVWDKLGISVVQARSGIVIAKVRPRSSAENIGIEPGDFLIALGGYAVRKTHELELLLQQLESGTVVSVVLVRGGRKLGGSVVIE